VHARPRQTATVAKLTVTDILQNFEFNLELECICARLAARRMTADERESLRAIVERMRPLVRKRNKEPYVELNRAFHNAIFTGSHNHVIETQARLLFSRLSPYRRQILLRPGQIEVSLRQHERILADIESGEAAAAEAAMRTHASLEDASFLDVIAMIERSGDG
jgi:DNA-binding GntR family transcriptional regulator